MNDEKTIYDDEKTQYQSQDEEATQYDDAYGKEDNKSEDAELTKAESPEAKKEEKKQPKWQRVAAGVGSGIILGAAATLFSASASIDHTEGGEGGSHPDWTDGEVPIASSVNDDMSFSEAFAAARTEVGSGGAFEWHGNIYSTFTEEEWNGMTAEQREEYGSHFSWNSDANHDTASTSHSSNENHDAPSTDDVEVVATDENNDQANQNHEAANEEVEVAEVTPTSHDAGGEDVLVSDGTDDVAVVDAEPEVEILGVVHDDESGANIGGLVVDGQEVVLIDVDGDTTFDVLGADANGDQQLSQDELVDISGQNITVNDLGGFSSQDSSMYASNENEIDYTNDAAVYDA